MSATENGGPAFPISLPGWGDNGAIGLSMRDYFAAKAMAAMLGHLNLAKTMAECESMSAKIPRSAYAIADAMLAERAK